MAKKVPHHNPTQKTVHVGGVSIFPMQTRMVDEDCLNEKHKGKKISEPSTGEFEVKAFLSRNVGEITAEVPDLDDEQLQSVLDVEQEGKKRKGVLDACADEMGKRFNSEEEAKQNLRTELNEKSDDELQQRLLAEDLEDLELAVLQELLSERKAASAGSGDADSTD